MNVVIFGAGAIGSLFGALLSKKNNVVLIGRTSHVNKIKQNGLKINGKTNIFTNISAEESVKNISFSPDLLILTVKSYDTKIAIKQAKKIIRKDTIVLSLQNGLDNIDIIEKAIVREKIIAGTTTHGAFFSEPGVISHTGEGETFIGELNGKKSARIVDIKDLFNKVGIKTNVSENIIRGIWTKAVINSSINPLTTFFQCKNGYLLENPVLEKIVEKICLESTNIAVSKKINLTYQDMIKRTKDVIRNTSENYSSMFQSVKREKRTEIDSINGKLVDIGKSNNVDCQLNEILTYLIKSTSNSS